MTGTWPKSRAQDAFAAALKNWPDHGVPRNPGAWLTTTARHRALDRLRRSTVGAQKLQEVARQRRRGEPDSPTNREVHESGIADDRLRLIFTCCHPALALEARVALTLRTLAGPDHRRDSPGLHGVRGNDGQAPGPGQAQDP